MRACVTRWCHATLDGSCSFRSDCVALAPAPSAGFAPPALKRADIPAAAPGTSVDVELVLAVDISYSMDPDEQALQREGYITALTSPEFLKALRQGLHGKIAVTYFEWAGAAEQKSSFPGG